MPEYNLETSSVTSFRQEEVGARPSSPDPSSGSKASSSTSLIPYQTTSRLARMTEYEGQLRASGIGYIHASVPVFIRHISKAAVNFSKAAGKKTVSCQHLMEVFERDPSLWFLSPTMKIMMAERKSEHRVTDQPEPARQPEKRHRSSVKAPSVIDESEIVEKQYQRPKETSRQLILTDLFARKPSVTESEN